MSDYYVCSDNIDGRENSRINALCSALKKAGHNATNGGVGPNTIQSHGQTGGANGQIGVFICGGVDIQVFWDFVQGIGSYYHYKRFIYVYASDTATTDKWLTCNGAKNTPTVQAHDDNYSGGRGDAIGKTVHQYCSEHKDKIWYACGPLGCSFDDVIQNFLKGEGAGDEEEDDDKKSSGSTIKEALKQVLYGWDGDAECYIRDDTVYVHKIPDPTEAKITIAEGLNVHYDSVTVTDYNPLTVNKLTVLWGDTEFEFEDKELIERFGEVADEVNLDETSSSDDDDSESNDAEILTEEDARSRANTEWAKVKRDNGHTVECKVTADSEIRVGQWVRAYLPSFNVDTYMYITKVSHDDSVDGSWTANITLADYPPSVAEKPTETESSDDASDSSSDGSISGDGSSSSSGTGDGSGSGSSSGNGSESSLLSGYYESKVENIKQTNVASAISHRIGYINMMKKTDWGWG